MPAPLFNETNLIDGWPNWQPRNGQKPRYFVLHTSEGAGGMDLVNYMRGASVSYHYVINNDSTVYDLVDTDEASWSCLDWNGFTINAVFGASRAAWTRQEWMTNMGNAIKIMAFICAKDCAKYGIPPNVSLGRPYAKIPTGIIDHRYITDMGVGSHVDIGDGFPADTFNNYVQQFYRELKAPAPSPAPAPAPRPPAYTYPTQPEMLIQIWEQLLGPRGQGWPQLGGRTLVDAVADLQKRIK
jgi:hypothetical protein